MFNRKKKTRRQNHPLLQLRPLRCQQLNQLRQENGQQKRKRHAKGHLENMLERKPQSEKLNGRQLKGRQQNGRQLKRQPGKLLKERGKG